MTGRWSRQLRTLNDVLRLHGFRLELDESDPETAVLWLHAEPERGRTPFAAWEDGDGWVVFRAEQDWEALLPHAVPYRMLPSLLVGAYLQEACELKVPR